MLIYAIPMLNQVLEFYLSFRKGDRFIGKYFRIVCKSLNGSLVFQLLQNLYNVLSVLGFNSGLVPCPKLKIFVKVFWNKAFEL